MKNSLLGVIDSNQSGDALQRQQELLQGSWISAYLPTWADFSLTRMQRLWGFALCLLLGVFCMLLSLMYLPSILISSRRFAFVYTMANMLLAGSTVFLVGPMQQLRNMFSSKERMIPSLVFIGSMFLTLFCAIGVRLLTESDSTVHLSTVPRCLLFFFTFSCTISWLYCSALSHSL